jgi:hypothetical protein
MGEGTSDLDQPTLKDKQFMNGVISVPEAIKPRQSLDGCCISIRGVLLAGDEISYLAEGHCDITASEKTILISDSAFFPHLVEKLDCYLGGRFAYEDDVVITGMLKVTNQNPPFLTCLTDIQNLEVEREGLKDTPYHYKEVYSLNSSSRRAQEQPSPGL